MILGDVWLDHTALPALVVQVKYAFASRCSSEARAEDPATLRNRTESPVFPRVKTKYVLAGWGVQGRLLPLFLAKRLPFFSPFRGLYIPFFLYR
jgi:hypothetical protein